MTFPARLLGPGEEVYLDSRPHWSLLFWPSVLTVLVIAGCVAVVVLWSSAPVWMGWVLLGIGLCALAYFAARYISWMTKSFVVTSQRIVYRSGIVRRTGREIPIGRVQDVTYHQTVVERIVRAGSLTVESAGRQGRDPFPDIRRPDEVQSLINRVVAEAAAGYPAVVAQMPTAAEPPPPEPAPPVPAFPAPSADEEARWGQTPPAAPRFPVPPPRTDPTPVTPPPQAPAGPTVAQRLEDLANLHKHGVITDAEFEQKRQELLDRL